MKNIQSDILLELHIPDFELAKKFYSSLGYGVCLGENPTIVMATTWLCVQGVVS